MPKCGWCTQQVIDDSNAYSHNDKLFCSPGCVEKYQELFPTDLEIELKETQEKLDETEGRVEGMKSEYQEVEKEVIDLKKKNKLLSDDLSKIRELWTKFMDIVKG